MENKKLEEIEAVRRNLKGSRLKDILLDEMEKNCPGVSYDKLMQAAMTLQKADVWLVSGMEPDFVRSIFLTPQPSAQAALDAAFQKLGPDATVLAMPYGGSTLPRIVG